MKPLLQVRSGAFAGLALLLAAPVSGQEAVRGRQPVASTPATIAEPAAPAEYTAHEWGTFTSVLDSTGKALSWNPYALVEPLPAFVRGPGNKTGWIGTVRMETPVVYFYSERALTLDARVDFPAGELTEWYPSAEPLEHGLVWRGFQLRPGHDGPLATTLSGEHYFAARGVAATTLVGASGEAEKFLFYRGVGSFEQPLVVRFHGEGEAQELVLENRGEHALGRVLLFENAGGEVALHVQGPLAPGAQVRIARSELRGDWDLSLAPLLALLREHGLFDDEAQAMVATWRRDWFGPGLRVFYVLPRADTDAVLPLTLTPPPARLERVLVGRLELLAPDLERDFLAAARALAAGTEPAEAMAALAPHLTRFPLALLQDRAAGEPALATADWKLQAWLAARRAW